MPKAPILNRQGFYTKLRGGTYRDLDWNLVNTSLGAMVEPRQLVLVAGGKITEKDRFDGDDFNSRTELSGDLFYRYHNTGGDQLPVLTNGQS